MGISQMLDSEILRANYVSFATYKRSGDAVRTPVWAGPKDDSLFIFSEGNAGKVKRLRNFSRAQIAPCTVTGRVTGNWYNAEACLLETDEDISVAYAALRAKYGVQLAITDFFSKLSGRYNQRALIRVDVGARSEV